VTRYLLDTNHAGILLRDDQVSLWDRLRSHSRQDCLLCRPFVAELLYMVFNSAKPEANAPRLDALLAQFDIAEFDAACAVEFGRLRAELRRQGTPIPLFDVLIASIARRHAFTLVTNDQHFSVVRGLVVENWLT
jgi:tRNA(fMet)-specific endonuclease VapC